LTCLVQDNCRPAALLAKILEHVNQPPRARHVEDRF
jgi:hypothetical protein